MVKAKRARTVETPKPPSLYLRSRAPYFYPTASEERFAEITPGKASCQSGLTATDEDWESERKQRDTEARGPTHESV